MTESRGPEASAQSQAPLPTAVGRFLGRVARVTKLGARAPRAPVDPRPTEVIVRELADLLSSKSDDPAAVARDSAFWSLVCSLYAKRPRVSRRGRRSDDGSSDADDAEASTASEDDDRSSDDVASAIGVEHEPNESEDEVADVLDAVSEADTADEPDDGEER